MSRDLYGEVTARILQKLESGTMPWVKPWSGAVNGATPCNAVTGRAYSGCNIILLWIASSDRDWSTPRYLTFKQAKESGGTVRKGEHGTKIVFVKKLVVKDKADPEVTRTIPMMREYTVFNVAQCEGLPEKISNPNPAKPRNKDSRDSDVDAFIESTGVRFQTADKACYVPSQDFICMPAFEAFNGAAAYYGTSFHELVHATGHKSRLDRDLKNRFGTSAYAAEELIAELGASFLSAEFCFDSVSQSAAYIASWIELLKNDSKAIVTAASKASQACAFLRDKALAEESTEQAAA